MSGLLTQSSAEHFQLTSPQRWVVERKFRCLAEPGSTAPYTALLLDRQYYLAQGAVFVRHVRQVHHNQATESLSQINIPFAPHRESLTVHWIRIWRAGNPTAQVKTAEEFTIKEGKQPNRLVAHFGLRELCKGDSLDVAYSVKAHTPVRHFSATLPTRQRAPILDWKLTAISPSDSDIVSQSELAELTPVVKQLSEGSQFYQWQLKDLPPIGRAENAPGWYRASPEIQLTNTPSWPKIAAGVYQRWQIPPLGPKVEALVKQFSAEAADDTWEAARRACRFVQDQISTVPTRALTQSAVEPGEAVLESSTGDAKAKACLLVQILRSLGIPAAPMLVSKSRSKTLLSMLPAADLFDHVIVRGRFEDQDFWIDPSASNEGGSIQHNTLPPYGAGLQVSTRTKKLCAIPTPDPQTNALTISEHFVLNDRGAATLKLTSRAIGIDANRLRKQIAEQTTELFESYRLETIQRRYPEASRSSALTIHDDVQKNEITVEETFLLSKITVKDHTIIHFSPTEIRRVIPSKIAKSEAPLALQFPCNVRYLIVVDTPWQIDTTENAGTSPGTAFAFSYKHSSSGRRHTLRYSYSTLEDHIVPVDFDSVQMRIDALRPHLDYRFAPPVATGSSKEKSGKGTRIIKEDAADKDPVRERKTSPQARSNWIFPIIGCIAAIALVIGVKASFQGKAAESSKPLREVRMAQEDARIAQEKVAEAVQAKYAIPDNPLELLPPPSTSSEFDELKFDIGSGTATTEKKASEKANATSGDWKLR